MDSLEFVAKSPSSVILLFSDEKIADVVDIFKLSSPNGCIDFVFEGKCDDVFGGGIVEDDDALAIVDFDNGSKEPDVDKFIFIEFETEALTVLSLFVTVLKANSLVVCFEMKVLVVLVSELLLFSIAVEDMA